ncbi:MAG: phenylalanine--tRNA ligase subunit alpha [Nanoarchaeota archaeon]
MDIQKLALTLHPLERTVLPFLENNISLKELSKKSNLEEVSATRAIQWLENKGAIKTLKSTQEIIKLDNTGKEYLKKELPEKTFLKALEEADNLEEIQRITDLQKDELNASLGLLRKNGFISIKPGFKIKPTILGEKYLKENTTENFLKSLPIEKSKLDETQSKIYQSLKQRKQIIKTETEKILTITLTKVGTELKTVKIPKNLADQLTSTMLKNNSWKNKQFRRYDVEINVPKIYPGKRHFVNQAKQHAKQIWLDMGFQEMTGPIINPSFWVFDALFTPQDHPVREMQDTFFVKGNGKLPDKKIVNKIKQVQEKSWKSPWTEQEAKRLVLRTHTTVLSAKTLSKLKKADWPAKFFAIGRNYRNEALDWSHSFEFNQSEGIVIDPDANFRNLTGYLKEFFKKMGYNKIRFRPGYFAYTEPSVEVDVYIPERKTWVELGGAGIFRPEVIEPLLGEPVPVLAWGFGLGRIILPYYGIKDIRELYKNDIKQLREVKKWL